MALHGSPSIIQLPFAVQSLPLVALYNAVSATTFCGVGTPVGEKEIVGNSVGCDVGKPVGSNVGGDVGTPVTDVGSLEGSLEGTAVGANDGSLGFWQVGSSDRFQQMLRIDESELDRNQ